MAKNLFNKFNLSKYINLCRTIHLSNPQKATAQMRPLGVHETERYSILDELGVVSELKHAFITYRPFTTQKV